MNLKEEKYSKYALVKEMLQTPEIIASFDNDAPGRFIKPVKSKKGLFLTGEGSSRIFPAKRMIYAALREGFRMPVLTEGCTQAREYKLKDYAVFAASNSGRTKEVVRLVIDPKIIDLIKSSDIVYFAGRDNGVAGELALKTNKITRKRSAFLEGTFALHGIEEVMDKG